MLLPIGNEVLAAPAMLGCVAMRFLISDACHRRVRSNCERMRRVRGCAEDGRLLVRRTMVKNACSTLVADLADVSRKGMESESARSLAVCVSTYTTGGREAGCAQGEGKKYAAPHMSRPPSPSALPYTAHLLLGDEIALISHEQLVDTLGCVTVDLV